MMGKLIHILFFVFKNLKNFKQLHMFTVQYVQYMTEILSGSDVIIFIRQHCDSTLLYYSLYGGVDN